jgi:hypothetical protein
MDEKQLVRREIQPRIAYLMLLCACSCLYVLSISWVIIGFPNISVSTGEFKPRAVYIDESSIQLIDWHQHQRRSLWRNHFHDKLIPVSTLQSRANGRQLMDMNITSLCNSYPYCTSYELISSSKLYESIIYPKGKALSSEAIVLVIPHSMRLEALAVDVVLQLIDIYSNHSPWLTKKVIILTYAVTKADDYRQVKVWLDQYHSLDHPRQVRNHGLLRESYILDLSSNSSHAWNRIQVKHIGSDGSVPNMDLISSLMLSKESYLLDLFPYKDAYFGHIKRAMGMIGLDVQRYRRYMLSLASLASSWQDMLFPEPEPSILISCFLKRNIDGLMLQPIYSGASNDRINTIDILTMVDKLIRISSALQGK